MKLIRISVVGLIGEVFFSRSKSDQIINFFPLIHSYGLSSVLSSHLVVKLSAPEVSQFTLLFIANKCG